MSVERSEFSVERSAPRGAVFLSYASQDAEAARRICDSLRQAGIEVWFDQSELRGGDAWDQSIRKQIKECALFVPIVSANTQARTEGYFRLEWRLADQRTHLMARGRPFLLPVVIDGTRDADAHVPDSFLEVQWTRLPDGEQAEKFAARVNALLSGGSPVASASAQPAPGSRAGSPSNPLKRAPWLVPAIAGAALVTALAVWRPWRSTNISVASPTSVSSAELSSARDLVRKARVLFESTVPSRDDFALAENYCRQALKLDENDAEVWAAYAELSSFYFRGGYDTSTERIELARVQAERAVKLAPRSFEARFAKASYLRGLDGPALAEAEKILRELAEENPGDGRVLIALGKVIWGALGPGRNLARGDEALAVFARAEKIPGSHAEAAGQRGWLLFNLERYPEAEAAIDDSLRLEPSVILVGLKVEMAMWRGDLATAEASLGQLPPDVLQIDNAVGAAAELWLLARKPDKCLATLSAITRDYLSSNTYIGTVDGLRGDAYQLGGKTEAARNSRQTALRVVERRLAARPRDGALLAERARLLALLDERDAAVQALRLYDEIFPHPNWTATDGRYFAGLAHVLLDSPDAAIALLAPLVRPGGPTGYLRLDFRFDALRGSPSFEALLASLESKPAAAANTPAEKSTPADKSVVVLPFANLSGDPAQEYFSDGLTEEILSALSNERDLRVPGRTSAFSFKGKSLTAPEIAHALNVAQVVEGSVRKAGDQVRITITLTRASDGFSEPLGTFTEKLEDIFALQEKVARAVVEKITQRTTTATTVAVQTRNPAAYDAYLRGRAAQMANGMSPKAIQFFKDAIRLDPDYALAWARLSQVYERRLSVDFDRSDENRAQAREAAEQALRLGRDLPEAHFAMAMIKLGTDWEADAAQRELDEAVRLRPSDPEAPWIQARIDYALGRWDNSLGDLILRAANLDRENAPVLFDMVNLLSAIGRFSDAEEWGARTATLKPNGVLAATRAENHAMWTGDVAAAMRFVAAVPESLAGAFVALMTRGDLRAEVGDYAGAIADYEESAKVAANLGDYSGPRGGTVQDNCKIARVEIRRGNRARADEILRVAQLDAQKFIKDFPHEYEGSLFLALACALRGEKEASRAALAQAKTLTQQAHLGVKRRVWLAEAEILALLGDTRAAVADLRSLHDRGLAFGYGLRNGLEWEPLRGDAGFQQLMKEAEARADAQPRPKK